MQRDCMFSDRIVEYMLTVVLALTTAKSPTPSAFEYIPSLFVLNSMPNKTTMPIASLMMREINLTLGKTTLSPFFLYCILWWHSSDKAYRLCMLIVRCFGGLFFIDSLTNRHNL